MVYMNEFDVKYAELYSFSCGNAMKLRLEIEAEFLEFVFKNSERQPCSVNGDVYPLKKIRNAAYMVLVTVRKNYALYFFSVVYKICHIGNNEVNSEHVVAREAETAVNNDYIVAVFKHS